MMDYEYLDFSSEVKAALNNKQPVVALETTLLTHGLPRPDNLHYAREFELIARENGVIPATIAIMHGKIKIGLNDQELAELCECEHAEKASSRDIAFAILKHDIAGTTIAATMACAEMAGISVFATGGIGGIHRDFHDSFDASADLIELARTPVAVVCSGAKNILDIAKTLEFLETHSVPVISFQSDYFPTFYCNNKQYPLRHRLDNNEQISDFLQLHWKIAEGAGVIIANPVPQSDAIPTDQFEIWLQQALQSAHENNISGKDNTPYLLKQLFALSEGKTLATNLALLRNNIKLGCEIAKAYARRDQR